MRIMVRNENILIENRFFLASIILVLVTGLLLFRLWYLQIYRGDYYRDIAERNRVRKVEIPAARGLLYDRYGELLLGNQPSYDLVYIPQYVKDTTGTFNILGRILHFPVEEFEKRLKQAKGLPEFLPIAIKRNLSMHEVSLIESNRVFLPGIEVRATPRRVYSGSISSHLFGYLREIDPEHMAKTVTAKDDNPYLPGDLVGKQGLEARWETYLRGKRGYSLVQVDVYGRETQVFREKNIRMPSVPARPGNDLELTLDAKLQHEARLAFAEKNGAIIVLDPRTGEVLAALSEPGFDPELMQGKLTQEDWRALSLNPFKPFLDKTTGGEFPPGSLYKALIALAALQEKAITPDTQFFCPGHYTLGKQTFYCHQRKGHGRVNLRRALMKSCDVYFYQVGNLLGVDRIARYAQAFGLGKKLGIELNTERPGLIPTAEWKMKTYNEPWAGGDTPNIAIGQGYNLLTPMQMATLYAGIATGGEIYRPYFVRRVTNKVGETILKIEPQRIYNVDIISKENFELVRGGLEAVVMDNEGTGTKARVAGRTVAGKTGSVQVVSLDRNRNQSDVSMKWKEHALFAAFSPVVAPEIVVVIVSENDAVGGGGRSAAPVAQRILAAYWRLKDERSGVKPPQKSEDRPKIEENKENEDETQTDDEE